MSPEVTIEGEWHDCGYASAMAAYWCAMYGHEVYGVSTNSSGEDAVWADYCSCCGTDLKEPVPA